MNSTTTRRATALVCAAVATLAMLAATDVLVTQMNSGAVLAATSPAQVVVITGQRAPRI
jgi:hypothetical protein